MRKPTRWYSNKQEQRVARTIRGKVVSNSGATPFSKGDVQSSKLLVECKTVTVPKQSVSIKKEWLTKNEEEAFAMGKPYSVLAFDFGDGEDYYIISKQLFIRLCTLLEEEM